MGRKKYRQRCAKSAFGPLWLNLQASLGEISLTRCRELVERAATNGGRPVRIIYVSDFDPAGQSMPVAAARKIEWLVREGGFENIQLHPIVLTYDQCIAYELPRTPLKETELRAGRFEARFGEGATELDALEALHPGELRRILVREIERFFDPDFDGEWYRAKSSARARLSEIEREILARHDGEVFDLERRLSELRRLAEQLTADLATRNAAIARELRTAAPDVDEFDLSGRFRSSIPGAISSRWTFTRHSKGRRQPVGKKAARAMEASHDPCART